VPLPELSAKGVGVTAPDTTLSLRTQRSNLIFHPQAETSFDKKQTCRNQVTYMVQWNVNLCHQFIFNWRDQMQIPPYENLKLRMKWNNSALRFFKRPVGHRAVACTERNGCRCHRSCHDSVIVLYFAMRNQIHRIIRCYTTPLAYRGSALLQERWRMNLLRA